jgi:two-component system chemotaxis response regulator CheY
LKILIAEDDAVSRTILRRAVEKIGHECLAAADGEEAWGLYKENPDLDVIISDWMMPGMDGLELCRRVRDDRRNTYTYFIFLTALGDREHLLQGLEAGADDYLSKPLDRDELGMRLTSALRVTELHRRLAVQNEELEKLNRMLFEQSRQDPLTSLGNRLRLREDLQATITPSRSATWTSSRPTTTATATSPATTCSSGWPPRSPPACAAATPPTATAGRSS